VKSKIKVSIASTISITNPDTEEYGVMVAALTIAVPKATPIIKSKKVI
jgi:hypothetical protein